MKSIHKRLGRGVRKYHQHFTKYLYERDTIFATIWVFLFIVILGSLPINLYVLNPLKLSLKDFDFNDLIYSELHKRDQIKLDNRIVLVNIGHEDREVLSMVIDKVAEGKPRVMALDAYFEGPVDPYKDSLLNATFARHPNLVAAQKLQLSGEDGDTIKVTGDYFKTPRKWGFVNFFIDDLSTFRTFENYEKDWQGNKYVSFAGATVAAYDSASFKKLHKKGNGKILINYTRRTDKYRMVTVEQLMTGMNADTIFKDRIVLMGYINTDVQDIEDKKFTPMNDRFAGKTIPDMNGLVVHANIISMVLDDNYIKKLPSWVNWLVAILIGWLHMSFFIRYYLENHIWFHLVAKLAQVASILLFAYLGIILFDNYNIKLDMKLSLLVIILAVDVIYFYEAFAVWIHKKFHYKTVFHQKHH